MFSKGRSNIKQLTKANTKIMESIIKYTAGAFILVVTVDILGFIAWIVSGQVPADGFYIGAITANILKVLLT